MDQDNLSIDLLLQETLALSEILKETSEKMQAQEGAVAPVEKTEIVKSDELLNDQSDQKTLQSDKFEAQFPNFENKMLEETFDQIEMIQRRNSLAIIEELRKEQLRKEELRISELESLKLDDYEDLELEESTKDYDEDYNEDYYDEESNVRFESSENYSSKIDVIPNKETIDFVDIESLKEKIRKEELGKLKNERLALLQEEELREQIRRELREELKRELKAELKSDLISFTKEQPRNDFNSDINLESRSEVQNSIFANSKKSNVNYPFTPGIIYKVDSSIGTFCVRGFVAKNINECMQELSKLTSKKRSQLKLGEEDSLDSIKYFVTSSIELAESIKEQILSRRFPHQEDSVCNISDPGFSWWMNADKQNDVDGKIEIYFKAHSVNRMDNFIQLGPIGDSVISSQKLNQARALLENAFPISEYSCDEKSFTVVTSKPDHLGFTFFKNIFLLGENNTDIESFPDNSLGKSTFYYFQELATVRKFWIEVKASLS